MRIEASVDQKSLQATLRALANTDRQVRAAVRKTTARVGSETVKQVRNAAPRGLTGQFKRSIAKVDKRYAKDGVYVSIIGQDRNRKTTDRQRALAGKRSGPISGGLSGRGFFPSIRWVESGTRPHVIKAKRGRSLYWNRTAGGRSVARRQARLVRHPGHRGTRFMEHTERRYRSFRVRMFESGVLKELNKSKQN